ncbi:nitrate reductase [Babesia caballi]|uniref:Nitrate reductase n=1 Tax=Babesia caballi TaxID=5871 RepID=A0AAV4LSC3_BABCB|nr:nitrate reductase [Babesia caballi]
MVCTTGGCATGGGVGCGGGHVQPDGLPEEAAFEKRGLQPDVLHGGENDRLVGERAGPPLRLPAVFYRSVADTELDEQLWLDQEWFCLLVKGATCFLDAADEEARVVAAIAAISAISAVVFTWQKFEERRGSVFEGGNVCIRRAGDWGNVEHASVVVVVGPRRRGGALLGGGFVPLDDDANAEIQEAVRVNVARRNARFYLSVGSDGFEEHVEVVRLQEGAFFVPFALRMGAAAIGDDFSRLGRGEVALDDVDLARRLRGEVTDVGAGHGRSRALRAEGPAAAHGLHRVGSRGVALFATGGVADEVCAPEHVGEARRDPRGTSSTEGRDGG